MEKLTESVGELKVFQLGTKEQTPDEGTATNERSTTTKRGNIKSPNLDGRNSRRTARANDQQMAKKARHKKNRTPIKSDDSTKTDVDSKVKVHDKKLLGSGEDSNLKEGEKGQEKEQP